MTANKTETKVAVIGLGIIGSIWAHHYQSDGLLAASWNRSIKDKEPLFTPDITEAVQSAEILHICVADPAAVRGILDAICPGLTARHLLIQSSTISPAAATEFAQRVNATGASYLEAPFTGSKPAAEQRQLVYFLGGSAAVIDRAEPILGKLSRKRFRFDSPAHAASLKLAMNLQIAAIGQALNESRSLAMAAGLDHETFFSVLRENVAHSGLADLKEPKLAAADDSPQFSVKHMAKDLGLALDSAGGLDLALTRSVHAIYQQGIDTGLGDADFIALKHLIEKS